MSVTFSSQQPIMAKTQFGNKPQAQAHVAQFSGTPHNPANATGPKTATRAQFGFYIPVVTEFFTCCCAGVLGLIGFLAYKAFKK